MNQKGFANIIITAVVVIAVGVAYFFYFNKPTIQETVLPTSSNGLPQHSAAWEEYLRSGAQGRDLVNVTTLRMTAQALQDYYRSKNKFPSNLKMLLDGYYINGSYPINSMGYTISSDSKHFVLSWQLEGTKDLLAETNSGKVNGKPLEKLEGTIYGIDCSDKKTFCLNEVVYKIVSPQQPVVQEIPKDIPSKISVRIDNGGVGFEKMNGSVVVVNWQYSGKSIKGGFTVERKLGGGSYQVIAQKYFSSSYYDKMVEEKNTYLYRVKANYTDTESSQYSDEISIIVPDSGTEISNVTVNTTNNSAEVSFVTTGNTKGSIQYQYDGTHYLTVEESDGGYKTNHKITVPNLKSGTSYQYRVIVGNKQGIYRTTDFTTFFTK